MPAHLHSNRQAIIDDYLAGVSFREIAERHGVAIRSISKMMRRAGVVMRRVPKKPQIITLADQGLSYKEITEQLGCTYSYVRSLLKGYRDDH